MFLILLENARATSNKIFKKNNYGFTIREGLIPLFIRINGLVAVKPKNIMEGDKVDTK